MADKVMDVATPTISAIATDSCDHPLPSSIGMPSSRDDPVLATSAKSDSQEVKKLREVNRPTSLVKSLTTHLYRPPRQVQDPVESTVLLQPPIRRFLCVGTMPPWRGCSKCKLPCNWALNSQAGH